MSESQTDQFDDLANREFTPLGQDAGSQADPDQNTEAQKLTSSQILAGAVAAGREVFCIVTKLESPKTHLDDATAKRLGDLWGPVLDKHGIDLSKYMGDYALEIAAVIGTITIGVSVRSAVIAEIDAREVKKSLPTEPPEEFETVQHGTE
jgi:hypothetical protein